MVPVAVLLVLGAVGYWATVGLLGEVIGAKNWVDCNSICQHAFSDLSCESLIFLLRSQSISMPRQSLTPASGLTNMMLLGLRSRCRIPALQAAWWAVIQIRMR